MKPQKPVQPKLFLLTRMSKGRFTPDFIDRLIASVDVASIIGRYTNLVQKGKRLVGLCPFHKEKTPSFTVDPDRGLYYCFGCQAGGSIFDFLMEKEGLTFPQAVEQLAEEAGIELPKSDFAENRTEGLPEATEFGMKFFVKAISSKIGEKARKYLEGRNIDSQTRDKFEIGWAPKDQLHLPKSIKKAGLSSKAFEDIGIVGRIKGKDDLFAKISDSLVIPIHNPRGKPVGFAHRKIDQEGPSTGPKYINSADNDIFHKSKLLYGLHNARVNIRQEDYTILVEGYFDVLSLYQAGFKNVVATCGTSLTLDQASLMARYSKRVTVLFDGDSAGEKATIRSLEILLSAGLSVKVLRLPEGEDPDSFLENFNADKMAELLENAPVWSDWLYDHVVKNAPPDIPKVISVSEAFTMPLLGIDKELVRNEYIRNLADKLGCSEMNLRKYLNDNYKKRGRNNYSSPEPEIDDQLSSRAKLELAIVANLTRCSNKIESDNNPLNIYPGLWKLANEGLTAAEIIAEISDSRAKKFLTQQLLEPKDIDSDKRLMQLITKLQCNNIDIQVKKLQQDLILAESEKDHEETKKIVLKLRMLDKKRRELIKS